MFIDHPNGRKLYVSDFKKGTPPRYSVSPVEALKMDKATTRRVDESAADHFHVELWTPALQEMLEEHEAPAPVIHFDAGGSDDTRHTSCGNVVHADSTSTDPSNVTCDHCRRRLPSLANQSSVSPRDIPVGYWPIKGKYFRQPIQTLPASYWVFIIDKTDLIQPGSYLYRYFKKNETTLRRRAKKRL